MSVEPLAKCGKIVIPGDNFSITGLPFDPTAVLFIWTDAGAEDAWTADSAAMLNLGMGFATYRNSESDTSMFNNLVFEINETNDLASTQDFGFCMGARLTRGSSAGWFLRVASLDAGGFTIAPPGGGWVNSGHVGKIVYYMAIGATKAAGSWFDQSHLDYDLGWEPDGWVDLGSSSTSEGYEGGIQWVDWLFAAFGAGHFWPSDKYKRSITISHAATTNTGPGTHNDTGRSWFDWENPDTTPPYSPEDQFNHVFSADTIGAGIGPHAVGYNTQHAKLPLSHNVWGMTDDGFNGGIYNESPAGVRVCSLAIQGGFECGSFTPSPTVGAATEVTFNIVRPKAIMLMNGTQIGSGPFMGQTNIGFVDKYGFQCTVYAAYDISGGHGCRYQSSAKAWVSNGADPIPIGSNHTLGTVTMTDTGFQYVTTENDAATITPIRWWAIGVIEDFIGQIYRISHY